MGKLLIFGALGFALYWWWKNGDSDPFAKFHMRLNQNTTGAGGPGGAVA